MKTDRAVRILVADDHKLFRSGIISLLSNEVNVFVVGEAESGKELINLYEKILPDVVLVDISMPLISGLSAVKEIKKKHPDVKALFLSMYDDEEYIYHTYTSGGKGLISKDIMKDELLFAIKEVYLGRNYFGRQLSTSDIRKIISKYEMLNKENNDSNQKLLTDQERKVLLLLSEGMTSSEIANQLEISKRTVDTHRANMMKKLKINSLPELFKYSFDYAAKKK